MLILHTAHTYAPEVNGVAQVVRQISNRLAKRGHEVHIATQRVRGTGSEETLDGVRVHRFNVDGNLVTGLKGDIAGYRSFVRSRRWDVIAMHCGQTWTTDALISDLGRLGGAVVFVGHGFSAMTHPKYRTYFVELGARLRSVDRIVALSPQLEEVPFCQKFDLPPPQIIPNGVNIVHWTGRPMGLRELWDVAGRPWLISLSNHSPVKGHSAFFRVADLVRKHVPDLMATIIGRYYPARKWRLGHIGIKGGCWYRCRLRSKMTNHVTLRWDLSRAEVVSAVQEADVLAITSWREASPLAVIESMAAGTPWVSFDVGCVKDNVGGFVVDTPQSMADQIVELLAKPSQRRELAECARHRVATRHDWESITRQYERLYQELTTKGVEK